jgi:hypothetical protein
MAFFIVTAAKTSNLAIVNHKKNENPVVGPKVVPHTKMDIIQL